MSTDTVHCPTILWIVRRNIPTAWETQHNWTQPRMQSDAQDFALRLFKWACVDFSHADLYCCVTTASPLLHAAIDSGGINARKQLFFQSRTFTVHMVVLTDMIGQSLKESTSAFSVEHDRIHWKRANVRFLRARSVDTIAEWVCAKPKKYQGDSRRILPKVPCSVSETERSIRVLDVWAECLITVQEQGVACRMLEEISELLHHTLIFKIHDRTAVPRQESKARSVLPSTGHAKRDAEEQEERKPVSCVCATTEESENSKTEDLRPISPSVADSGAESDELQEELGNWLLID